MTVNGGPLPDSLARLAELGTRRSFRRGALLIQEGDVGDSLYVIASGRLRAFCANEEGKEVTLGVYGAGDYVGEMALDGGPRSASVETLEASVCSVVSRQALLAHIGKEPEFALELLRRVIRRARLATNSTRSLALIDVYGRLANLLNEMAGEPLADGSRRLGVRITHQEMATQLACSREMVSRLMKDLERGGYVRKEAQRIVLVKPLPARW